MIEILPNWHPLFVHFTVALLSIASLFFLLAWIFKARAIAAQWASVAYWNLWLGMGFAVITALAGWDAYNTVAHDTPSHAAMTDHRNWALATLAVYAGIAAWSAWQYRAGKEIKWHFLLVVFIGAGLLASTGWRGGELVYRYGLGVMSMPKAEGEGHAHEHGGAGGHAHGDVDAHTDTDMQTPHEHTDNDDATTTDHHQGTQAPPTPAPMDTPPPETGHAHESGAHAH